MYKDDHKEWLLSQIKVISELLKEGRYDEIDLSAIEREASDMAKNFDQVIKSLESAGQKMSIDSQDLPRISEHLSHISESTEKGIMTVINNTESIMEDATNASEVLYKLQEDFKDNEEVKNKIQEANDFLDSAQGKCFNIITSVEFEDINRQLLDKILGRLNELYDNLLKILLMLKLKERLDNQESGFLESLKHIIDIEGGDRQSQEMIDDLFEDFNL